MIIQFSMKIYDDYESLEYEESQKLELVTPYDVEDIMKKHMQFLKDNLKWYDLSLKERKK